MNVKDMIIESNPDALLYDGCDASLVGVGGRCGQPDLAVYDYHKLIEVFEEKFSDDDDPQMAAQEWVDFNIVGGWIGDLTPIILYVAPI
jgi:hypothetical protein